MDKQKLKNILTKIGEVNPDYSLDKQVYNNGGLIQFMDNPTEDIWLAAVKKNPIHPKSNRKGSVSGGRTASTFNQIHPKSIRKGPVSGG
ncbi:hypothetical protein EBU71_08640 [bacterium]|nr:hypothetical protein [Candidatus Elulimicrobium humile]